ncbi:MAG: hypothetical protein QX197_17145 [Methylococcaceae bacterium]
MKRSNTMGILNFSHLTADKRKVAYHEAGHATAIHFNNTLQRLPPVFFHIVFGEVDISIDGALNADVEPYNGISRIEGGRFIQALALAFDNLECPSSEYTEKRLFKYADAYRLAFEADIVNLLIGPLAEAKYCMGMDNEPFDLQLLTVAAMKNYGGAEDLLAVNDYLRSYSVDKQTQNEVLKQFFTQAYDFVNDSKNWAEISKLATYILASGKDEISCDEVMALLDGH